MLPFDVQRFASEAATGLAVFILTQVPRGWRAVIGRLKPNPLAPELRFYLRSSNADLPSVEGGTLGLFLELVNLSRRDMHVEQLQVTYWRLGNAQVSSPDGRLLPPRVTVPAGEAANANIELRINRPSLGHLAGTLRPPSQHVVVDLTVAITFVLERRFTKPTLSHREVTGQVHLVLPSGLIQ